MPSHATRSASTCAHSATRSRQSSGRRTSCGRSARLVARSNRLRGYPSGARRGFSRADSLCVRGRYRAAGWADAEGRPTSRPGRSGRGHRLGREHARSPFWTLKGVRSEGLAASEVGKEMCEHAKHGNPHERRDRLISITEAVLLSVVALLAAWSGYAAAKWSTESRVELAEASAMRIEASRADSDAGELRDFALTPTRPMSTPGCSQSGAGARQRRSGLPRRPQAPSRVTLACASVRECHMSGERAQLTGSPNAEAGCGHASEWRRSHPAPWRHAPLCHAEGSSSLIEPIT